MNRHLKHLISLTAPALVALAIGGCASTEEQNRTSTSSKPAISAAHAKAIWLPKFLSVVEAHAVGEAKQTLHSPGVEQECTSKESAYQCVGIVPEEEGSFVPGHEENCLYVTMTIDPHTGHIKEESAGPISEYRKAFHTEVECHL